jgi:hypothetical protein
MGEAQMIHSSSPWVAIMGNGRYDSRDRTLQYEFILWKFGEKLLVTWSAALE